MALPRLIPALGDLTQDIAGPLPVDLFREWVAGNQNVEKAETLLRPFAKLGTVVSTDASGLSQLTEEMDLLDVLALVSRPKEIVHALGSEIGGRAIGIWVADNTEMLYPSETPIALILGAMREAHLRIDRERAVRIGMCVHQGEFYEIAGGLYGHDADAVEYLAERFAAPGEILLTHPVMTRAADAVHCERRPELDVVYDRGVYRATTGAGLPELRGDRVAYPHPFPDEFFQALLEMRAGPTSPNARTAIYQSLMQDRVIVFIARERDYAAPANITALLDNLVTNAVMEAIVAQSKDAHDHVASLGGGLAILSFADAQHAVDVSLAMRDRFLESGLPVKIGIDAGRVLMLAKQRGPSGISGDAVNIASKISEDFGVVNMVTITARVVEKVKGLDNAAPFSARIAKIHVTGVRA